MAGSDTLDQLIEAFPTQAAGPSRKVQKDVTYEDFQRVLDSTPLFMKEIPHNGEENEVLEALKSLVFEGEGDEVARNFKDHGNELYAQKSYTDAVKTYGQGLDAKPADTELQISLLNNRAAANLSLKNYGAVLKDVGVVIALCTMPKDDGKRRTVPAKAMYRAAQSLVALERWDAALDCIERGRQLPGEADNKVWATLQEQAEKGKRRELERAERIRRDKLGKKALRKAIESRGLVFVDTPAPPDNPHPVHFDPEAVASEPPLRPPSDVDQANSLPVWSPPPPHTSLVFPVFLLYPAHQQSDLISHFHEDTSLDDQLAVMFPSSATSSGPSYPPWDTAREYMSSSLMVYAETAQQRLLKVGKELTLREVLLKAVKEPEAGDHLGKDGIVLRDGLLSFVVLVKGKQEKGWIEQYKKKRDEGKK